jgi:hypothetical protein
MSEVTRFRIARPPAAATSASLNAFHYPAREDKSLFGCDPDASSHVPRAAQFLKQATSIAAPVRVEPPCPDTARPAPPNVAHPQARLLGAVARFLAWLEAHPAGKTAAACQDWLAANALDVIPEGTDPSAAASAMVSREDWKPLRVSVGDSLIASVIDGGDHGRIDYLTRLFRVLSLIELLAAGALPDGGSAAAVLRLVANSVVLLPHWLQAARWEAAGRSDLPLFTRAPGFSDLVVVREEWSCYQPGEVAHIENVLRGEKKVRAHERLEEVETRAEEETTTTNYEERDTQTTDRQSLKEEAQKQTQLEVGLEGQVDTSGQYGPTRVNTHLGARLSYSVQEARQRVNEQSREIVDRAVSRVETRVRELRATRALRRITERNEHTLDNTRSPTGHVVGIYRWVDRIVRLQAFRYRHRFLLEFEIPEPAAHYRWLQQHAPQPPVHVDPPPPFSPDEAGNPLVNPEVPLNPSHLDRGNYQHYVAKFGAAGVLPPPDGEVSVSGAITLAATEGQPDNRDEHVQFVPHKSGKIELAVPHNYRATSVRASVAGHPTLARWRDQPDESDDGYVGGARPGNKPDALGYHNIVATFTCAGKELRLSAGAPARLPTVRGDVHHPRPDINAHMEYEDAWVVAEGDIPAPRGSFGSEKLDVGVLVGGAFEATASVIATCRLLDSAYEAWRLETFDRLQEAYRAAADAYREARVAARIRREDGFAQRSPARNAEIVREELKRQVIEMLTRETFRGFELKTPATAESAQGPTTRLREAADVAPLIQFLEQAFEWSNMTYIMYPYYWTADSRWKELQMIEGPDANFVRFLRSGSARVIVPARPGFQHAVMYFSIFGVPWSGGVPPIPGDELYVSVAQEIQEMTGAPDEGEPGLLWEERLPTTLVWLDDDPNLPRNEHRRLNGTPSVDLCGRS